MYMRYSAVLYYSTLEHRPLTRPQAFHSPCPCPVFGAYPHQSFIQYGIHYHEIQVTLLGCGTVELATSEFLAFILNPETLFPTERNFWTSSSLTVYNNIVKAH